MDNAKPPKDPNCIERRSGNQLRDGKRGDRKSRRAVTKLRRLSTLSKRCELFISLPTERAFTVATLRSFRAHAAGAVELFLVSLRSEGPDGAPDVLKPC
eukprot:6142408-Pleurochrysis_carterae.AAC.1